MKTLEEIFGISIENSEFFIKALTHPSYTKEKEVSYLENYERLEFLGDAVLKLSISDILYKKYPDYAEGELSKIRSIVVSDNTLFKIVKKNGLAELIRMGRHEEKQGCRKLESICACTFEAVLGAYYLDGKFDSLLNYLEQTFIPYIDEVDNNFEKYNAKALLQEYTQGINKDLPVYVLKGQSGPDHNKTFTVEVTYRGEYIASGEGKSKKEAEQKAAYEACKKFGVVQCQE